MTLVGPGGIGKTRLAVAAARQIAVEDGAWLVDLAEIGSPGDVPRAVAGTLEIKEGAGRTLTASIVTALRTRRTLLVLDNCEHVVDGAAALAQAVAEGCPGAQVLATSREGLGLGHGHERLVPVPPLDPAGAGADLFSERAAAVAPTFDPRASRPTVEQICRRLDGVPLAIELAAAWTASLTPAELLDRLDDQLRLLVGGRRTAAARHRTLRATIAWSYDLLSPSEQVLLQRLSVLAGPFDRAAAEAVAGAAAGQGTPHRSAAAAVDTGDVLHALVQRSMVVAEAGRFGQRFRLLETMRQFAAERLAPTGDSGLVAGRHARWCIDRVTELHRLLTGPAEVEGVARLDELWPNLRAALAAAATTGDRRLMHGLVRPVVAEVAFRNRSEIGDWVERLLAITPPEDRELVVFGLAWAAQRYKLSHDPAAYQRLVDRYGEPDHPLVRHARAAVTGDYAALADCAPAALAERRRRGEHDLAEQLDLDVGAALLFCGRSADGDARIAALAERYRRQGPPTLLSWAPMLLGYSASVQGRHEHAGRLLDEAVGVEVPEHTHSPSQAIRARAVFRRGDRPRAFRLLGGYVEDLLDTGNMQGICAASVEFVNMVAALDRLPDAACLLRYLDTTGLLDAAFWSTQVAAARDRAAAAIRTAPDRDQPAGHRLDDRRALEYMRRVLDELERPRVNSTVIGA